MSPPNPGSLADQATAFADSLTCTVRGVIAGTDPFVARVVNSNGRTQFAVDQNPETGIALPLYEGAGVTLTARYKGALDGPGRYIRVERSSIAVWFGPAGGAPLFRYDYDRSRGRGVPRAHFQVGEGWGRAGLDWSVQRDLAATASLAGRGTRTGRRASDRYDRGKQPRADSLHFPLGGDRFRPALEDVLEMLVEQLGVRAEPGWREAIDHGRREWRTTQLKAAVRDNPQPAAATLEELGYTVAPPTGGHPEPTDSVITSI